MSRSALTDARHETTALGALSHALRAAGPQQSSERLLAGLEGVLGVSGGLVVLRDDDGGGRVLASRGVPSEWATGWESGPADDLDGRIRGGLDDDPPSLLRELGVLAVWTSPLGSEGEPVGALVLTSNDGFTDADQEALSAAASAFGSWIELSQESSRGPSRGRASDPVGAALSRQPDLAVVRTTAEGHILEWPEAATRLLGWSEEDVARKSLELVFSEEDRAAFVRRLREPEIDPAGEWKVRLATSEGETAPCGVRLLFASQHDEVVVVLRSRRGDEASERWLRWSRALLSVLDASTIVLDPGGRIRELSGGWVPGSPKDVAKWLGRHLRELFESDRREVLSALRAAARNGEWTGQLLRLGVPVSLRLSAVRDADGNLEALVGARLPENAAEAGTLFRNLPVGMMLVGPDLRVQEVNPELRTLCGTRGLPDEPEGLDVRSLAVFQSRPAQQALDRLASGHAFEASEIRLKGAAESVVQMRGKAMTDGAGELTGYLLMFASATGNTSRERQIIRAQKMESIGAFASGLSHDFGNYVALILGKAGVLRMKLPNDPHITSELDDIEAAAKRAQHLSLELMRFSRGSRSRLSSLDLNDLVDEAGVLVRTSVGKKIDVSLRLQDDLDPIDGDEVELQQLVLNLSLNARDAMPDGGTLTIETRSLTDEQLLRLGSDVDSGVSLVIRDTGDGIPAEVAERVFEPFFTTKVDSKGTGLGLAMVYGIVRRHGGLIDVHSEPGEGTEFEIFFPASSFDVARTEPASPRILVVDDDPAFREMIRLILEEDSHDVTLAASGAEALKTLRTDYDDLGLVILDLKMPGVDGLSVLEELRTLAPELPVLVTTGYASREEKDQALRRGAELVLEKPYRVKDFRQALAKLLRRPGEPEGPAPSRTRPPSREIAAELSLAAREAVTRTETPAAALDPPEGGTPAP